MPRPPVLLLACLLCEVAIVGAAARTAEAAGRCPECGARIVEEEPEEQGQPQDELEEGPAAAEALPAEHPGRR